MADIDIDVEYRELTQLDDDWTALPKGFMRKVERVVGRGAFNIKKGWKRRWEGHDFIPHLPNAISYDVTRHGTGGGNLVRAEIGPDKNKRQGPLGNIIEFGSPTSAPIPGGVPALEEEEPRFVNALADLGEKETVHRGPR